MAQFKFNQIIEPGKEFFALLFNQKQRFSIFS